MPVIDKSKRDDGTFSRQDFTFDKQRNVYVCPPGKLLRTTGRLVHDGETDIALLRRASLRLSYLPAEGDDAVRKCLHVGIPRSIHENARDVAQRTGRHPCFRAVTS